MRLPVQLQCRPLPYIRLLLALTALMSNACLEVPEKPSVGANDAGGADGSAMDAGNGDRGRIALAGKSWLSSATITVTFTGISRNGDPFIAIYAKQSPSPVTSFRVRFRERELAASGTHTFDPLPVGTYVIRLVYDADQVAQELPFTVRGDRDGDRVADDEDGCPDDQYKQMPGMCKCGVPDDDGDMDGTPDCIDGCPADMGKTAPGMCECAVADTDTDDDGTPDCDDLCPTDKLKTVPGVCMCGKPDTDTDKDTTLDCLDRCETDRMKVAPGLCGCGFVEGTCGAGCSKELLPDVQLFVGDKRCSPNGKFQFGLGADGYLTLREGTAVLWAAYQVASGTQIPFVPAASMKLQSDGNLVALSAAGAAVWSSGAKGKDAIISVEDNGAVEWRVLGVVVFSIGPYKSGDIRCGEARENQTIRMACPAGRMISSFEFASYGKPTGTCGDYVAAPPAGDQICHFDATSIVQTACVGANSCAVVVEKPTFPFKNCAGAKRLLTEYRCSGDECPDDPNKEELGVCGCGVPDTDGDSDATPDCKDDCPVNNIKTAPGACGCAVLDTDTDKDNTADCKDLCPDDGAKTVPGACGCNVAEGCAPPCSNQLLATITLAVGDKRCSQNGKFSFGLGADGYLTLREGSEVIWTAYQSGPAATMKVQGDGNLVVRSATAPVWSSITATTVVPKPVAILTVEDNGSVVLRHDTVVVWSIGPFQNGDTLCREARENQAARLSCPAGQTISAVEFASYGTPTGACGTLAIDMACHYDAESFVDMECVGENMCQFPVDAATFTTPCAATKRLAVAYTCEGDACPDDPTKVALGACGCGVPDDDGDSDGTPDCNDACPVNAPKTEPGVCGCAVADTAGDGDSDGTPDCIDACPANAPKIKPGACGCAVADTDGDSDGTPDCNDLCPADNLKTAPGTCGCAVAETSTDTDSDGTVDCIDACPTNPLKIAVGACGCAVAETDTDNDGTPNCDDLCPLDPAKVAVGVCGCGIEEGNCPPDCSNELLPNAKLLVGEKRCSPNGRFKFILGTDGAVTLREGNEVIWAAYQLSGTPLVFNPAATVTLQGTDSNLVARMAPVPPATSGASAWSLGAPTVSPAPLTANAILTVEDNGSVVLRAAGTGSILKSIGPFENGATRCRDLRENQTMRMACPLGTTISTIQFASYGKPTGTCGSYAPPADGTCHLPATSAVETRCLNANTCEFLIDKVLFPFTACSGQKRLAVAYLCSGP